MAIRALHGPGLGSKARGPPAHGPGWAARLLFQTGSGWAGLQIEKYQRARAEPGCSLMRNDGPGPGWADILTGWNGLSQDEWAGWARTSWNGLVWVQYCMILS